MNLRLSRADDSLLLQIQNEQTILPPQSGGVPLSGLYGAVRH